MYESGRIMGKGKESNDTLETAEQLLDCNVEMPTRIHTKSKRTQRFTKQTTQLPRKTHGKTGTHTNITTQQQEMLGIAGKTILGRIRKQN
jgi:hypothetical protein